MAQPAQQPSNVTALYGIPKFEGADVAATEVRISGASAVDATDVVISTDDRVRLVGEYRVVGVRHELNKDGELIRVQVLKPILVQLCPFDPSDPNDDGIVRARPRPV